MDIENKVLTALNNREQKEGPLPRSLEVYRDLLRIQTQAGALVGSRPSPTLTPDAARDRLERGIPLLEFDDLQVEWPLLQSIFKDVVAVISRYPELSEGLPASLNESLPGIDFFREAGRAWFNGTSLETQARESGIGEGLLELIVHAAFKPFLATRRDALLKCIDQEWWRRGHCPVCGGSPDFAFLEGERAARWLLCSRCDAEWLFQRLECPYCGTSDQKSLSYFTDDNGLYRLYVCDNCRCYLKAMDLRHARNEVAVPLERFLTLDIDAEAQEKGYHPCTRARTVQQVET